MTHDELIKALETATGPSRELDAEIWVSIHGKGQPIRLIGPPTYNIPRMLCNPDPSVDWVGYDLLNVAPRFTASIDAALTLMLEGWKWVVSNRVPPPRLGRAYIYNRNSTTDPDYLGRETTAATPAIALCIAALKARGK